MLTKLLPDQISKFWNIIKYAIEESLPPITGQSPDRMQNILTSCLDGSLDVWVSYKRIEDKTKLEGVVLTEFTYDKGAKVKNLLIYCLYGYEIFSVDTYKDGIITLLKYAHGKGCSQVNAYTNIQSIVELVKKFGGESDYTFISFDVKKCLNLLEV